jgi:hypothetical protein
VILLALLLLSLIQALDKFMIDRPLSAVRHRETLPGRKPGNGLQRSDFEIGHKANDQRSHASHASHASQ